MPKVEGYSPIFNDLLQRLLKKDPSERIYWEHLRKHPFWTRELNVRKLPRQPTFDGYLKTLEIDPEEFAEQQAKNGYFIPNLQFHKKPSKADPMRVSQSVKKKAVDEAARKGAAKLKQAEAKSEEKIKAAAKSAKEAAEKIAKEDAKKAAAKAAADLAKTPTTGPSAKYIPLRTVQAVICIACDDFWIVLSLGAPLPKPPNSRPLASQINRFVYSRSHSKIFKVTMINLPQGLASSFLDG